MGIATTIVSFGFIVFLGVAGSAAVVAFGLGTRDVAAQLAAGQCLRRLLRVGEVIQYGMYEGTVRELGLTHVVVESGDGLVIIPNTELLRATVVKRQAVPQAT
ncbi:MAG: hypothetical protein KatS3mg131_1555 [Candidatus Tectimicrobiota bacterium]|nr:MAG: hypothetical protein KatS3mg131_1555 [Candidatus Tectomicrobia bacterium]